MSDPASDFIKDYQALAQQSWDSWARQLQQSAAAQPFAPPAAAPLAGSEAMERTLAGLKGYFDWMQGAAASGAAPPSDWRVQLQQLFGGGSQPFAQAFAGIDSSGAEGFSRQWQSWMQAAQRGGLADLPGAHGVVPAFGLSREQQMQQQAMSQAMLESLQASARYQALIQRANAQSMERLQDKLAERAEPGRQVDSLKALYDLWVDAAEEAYAGIALSDEFRQVYGDMVNAQMRVRQLQLQQTEQMCQQLGLPTRSEVASLGERLQALRRELRAGQSAAAQDHAGQIAELQQELAALRQRLVADTPSAKPISKRAAPATPSAPSRKMAAKKKPASQAPAAPARKSASVRKAPPAARRKPAASAKPRKRT